MATLRHSQHVGWDKRDARGVGYACDLLQACAHRQRVFCADGQAAHALAQIENLSATTLIPERYRHEILNRRAQAAIALEDLDAFRDYTLQSAESLKHVHSEKRRQELIVNYKAARKKWPDESQVLEIADVLL
jgi:hypothetical protein